MGTVLGASGGSVLQAGGCAPGGGAVLRAWGRRQGDCARGGELTVSSLPSLFREQVATMPLFGNTFSPKKTPPRKSASLSNLHSVSAGAPGCLSSCLLAAW